MLVCLKRMLIATLIVLSNTIFPLAKTYATPFTHDVFGFSLDIPDDFEQIPIPHQGVALALRNRSTEQKSAAQALPPQAGADKIKGEHFPTLTITAHPGGLSLDPKYAKIRAEEILTSYRSIGYAETELKDFNVREVNDQPELFVQLTYPRDGESFESQVALIPGKKLHFILTYIDRSVAMPQSSLRFQQLLKSFRVSNEPPRETKKKPGLRDRIALLFYVLIGALALIFLMRYQLRGRK